MLGHLLALCGTPANADDRSAVSTLAEAVQDATGESVDLVCVDQGYSGERPAQAAAVHGITLEVVKLPKAKRCFVLLPRMWVVNAPSAGLPASAASPATTSDCPRHPQDRASSPSVSSYSARRRTRRLAGIDREASSRSCHR
jgi:transposase